jgi:hypothetical protein
MCVYSSNEIEVKIVKAESGNQNGKEKAEMLKSIMSLLRFLAAIVLFCQVRQSSPVKAGQTDMKGKHKPRILATKERKEHMDKSLQFIFCDLCDPLRPIRLWLRIAVLRHCVSSGWSKLPRNEAKNQGESRLLKPNQGESRVFETFFYAEITHGQNGSGFDRPHQQVACLTIFADEFPLIPAYSHIFPLIPGFPKPRGPLLLSLLGFLMFKSYASAAFRGESCLVVPSRAKSCQKINKFRTI